MCPHKGFFIFFLIAFIVLPTVKCNCVLKVYGDSPVIERNLGSHRFIQSNLHGDISIKVDETVDVYCSGSVITESYYKYTGTDDKINHLKLQCLHESKDIFIINDHYELDQFHYNYMKVNCDNKVQQLFESNSSLPNCDNYLSYGIGSKSFGENVITTVGVCYDLNALTIKYAKYLAYRPEIQWANDEHVYLNESLVNLDVVLDTLESFFFKFGSSDCFKKYYQDISKSQSLLSSHAFDFATLLQDNLMAKDLEDFEYILNIIWWRNLRQGNWRYFLDALEARSQAVTYLAYTGVSGALKIPSSSGCSKAEVLQVKVHDNGNEAVAPAFIWTYLKSLNTVIVEEIVLIGHNTPYYNDGSAKKFCEDKCHEIDWLNESLFGKLHMMPIYGVVQCCYPAEVAHQLDNFPYELVDQLSSTKKLISTESTTTDEEDI